MGNATLEIGDFGGGMYRGRTAPANAVYDALNALINDEGQLFKRGGSVYKSNTNAAATLVGLWDGQLIPGGRTVFWSSAALYVLGGDDATPVSLTVTQTAVGP